MEMIGKKFNRWTVESFSHSSGKKYWNCVCDCGNTQAVTTGNLKNGRSMSCGCSRIRVAVKGVIKTCKTCKEDKCALTEFPSKRRVCMKCVKKAASEYALLMKFGVTAEQYGDMYKQQKGCCALCDIHSTEFNKKLAVDHCHVTGKVRGLLCATCNIGLGQFKDKTEVMKKAIEYLENEGVDYTDTTRYI
jgi:hypothetical protein